MRRDHAKILGVLFIVWAAVQLGIAWIVASPYGVAPAAYPKLTALVSVLVSVAYLLIGLQLRRHDTRSRTSAIVLCVLALLSFPLGTALGAYGLWALLGSPKALSESRA